MAIRATLSRLILTHLAQRKVWSSSSKLQTMEPYMGLRFQFQSGFFIPGKGSEYPLILDEKGISVYRDQVPSMYATIKGELEKIRYEL